MYRVRRDLFETEIEKYPQCQGQGLERGDRKEGDRELYIHFLFVCLRVFFFMQSQLTDIHCVAKDDLKFLISGSLVPEFWHSRHVPST